MREWKGSRKIGDLREIRKRYKKGGCTDKRTNVKMLRNKVRKSDRGMESENRARNIKRKRKKKGGMRGGL